MVDERRIGLIAIDGATAESLSGIAELFPSLRGVPGVRPFKPAALAKLVEQADEERGNWTETERRERDQMICSVEFVLWLCVKGTAGIVQHSKATLSAARFDPYELLANGVWDLAHREAFATWATYAAESVTPWDRR